MTVAIYVRVSTDDQADKGFSLEAQKERLMAFCKSQGWLDVELYMDDGYTATNMDRPALKRLISAAKRKHIEAVVVYRLDRLSRKQRDVLYLIEDVFDTNNVSFRSATEPFDTSTPLGRAMLGILGVFAQLERDTTIERTKSGIKQRVRQGLWHGANYPFGYTMNKDTGILEIIPEQANLVRRAYEKFLAGETRADILRWLEKRTTARDINTLFVRRLLTRQTYVGRLVLNGEVFDGQHEPIIDVDTFDRVQAKLKGIVVPRGSQKYLLSGLMKCGVCGDGMHYWETVQRRKTGKEYRYMRVICNTKRQDNSCDSKSILAREVESEVVRLFLSLPLDFEYHATEKPQNDISGTLEQKIKSLDEQRARLLDAVQSGAVPIDLLKDRFDAIERERKATFAQLDDIAPDTTLEDTETMIRILKQAQQTWDYIEEDEQRILVRSLIKSVKVYPDKRVEISL